MSDIHMTAGMDIGNGYVKARVACDGGQPRGIDLPSSVTYVSPSTAWLPKEPSAEYVDDLVNELDCTIDSPCIRQTDRGRILVGNRSVDSGDTQVLFNIDDHVPKCDDSLAYELALSVLAAEAVRHVYAETGALPTDVPHVTCAMGVALPISDYMDYRDRYRANFMGSSHRVTIHNFERPIAVDITFDVVTVLAEGAAAQYAINALGPKYLDLALAQSRAAGVPCDESETGETLFSYKNTALVDIGEGTTNFPIFRDSYLSPETSSSINEGYGTVLSKVVAATRNLNYAPATRKELAAFMLDDSVSGAKRKIKNKLQRLIDEETSVFVRDVVAEYKHVLSRTKLSVDVTYVFGGGAAPVRTQLLPAIVEASRLDDDIYIPVIYLDSAYSRDLNRNGLYIVAQLSEQALAQQASQA